MVAAVLSSAGSSGDLSDNHRTTSDVTVMNIGRRRFHRVNELALTVNPEVALHAEVPLPPLLRLVHRGVARAGRVLRRGGGRADRGIHYCLR